MIENSPIRIVVFDIGGVLVRISHLWADAAHLAGVTAAWSPQEPAGVNSFEPLEDYQTGRIGLDEYLGHLGNWAACSTDQALAIHNAILVEEYPGVRKLISDLQSRGILTGCLSNTNAAHWVDLVSDRFPAVAMIERKMASHLVGLSKPGSAIYLRFAEENDIRPQEAVFFDDSQENVDSAAAVGYLAKRIDPEGDTAAQMRDFLQLHGVLAE